MTMLTHIVQYSGGVGSWAAAWRVVQRYGPERIVLLFCDTLIEDADLYRFLEEGAQVLGLPVLRIADGRTPWEVFRDEKFLGNTRADPCSRILKRDLASRWIREHYTPDACRLYVGIDACQRDAIRFPAIQAGWAPYQMEAPLLWDPPCDKDMAKGLALRHGVVLPRLYAMGFAHNNCGGFCIKGGQAQFRRLAAQLPDVYAYHEAQEDALRDALGKNVAILRDRRRGRTIPLTLRDFRTRMQQQDLEIQETEEQSCQCFFSF